MRVGDPVVAIGNPFGLDRTATAGIVSAVQERTITAPNGSPIDHVIQTDAPINRGNSGGPLLNSAGEVIGVNSQITTGGDTEVGDDGIGFAVPSNTVRSIVAQLVAKGRVDRAHLGVGGTTVTPELARLFGLPVDTGVLIEQVRPGSPAAKAELRGGTNDVVLAGESYSLGGDVIVAIDGEPRGVDVAVPRRARPAPARGHDPPRALPRLAPDLGARRARAAAHRPVATAARGHITRLWAWSLPSRVRFNPDPAASSSRTSCSSRRASSGRTTPTTIAPAGTASAPTRFPARPSAARSSPSYMTAAHLILVWEERDDPNLLWHAQRAKEVGRNPRVVAYEREFGPSASYYAWEAAGRPVHAVRGKYEFGFGAR